MATCYNKGCGQVFVEEDNKEESCTYHPGDPFFHDAYKIWSCCDKKSTDFTTWLSLAGCTKGPHSNVKPEPKTLVKETAKLSVGDVDPPKVEEKPKSSAPIQADERDKEPMVEIAVTSSDAVRNAAEQRHKELVEAAATSDNTSTKAVTIGTNCKANSCTAVYAGDATADGTPCVHHPGVPVFHEGMKYWSCCKRKTSDFDAFMSQEGCAKGETHQWSASTVARSQQCRFEWFQTPSLVTITVYSKGCIPSQTSMSANGTTLSGHITYAYGASVFPLHFDLWRRVDVGQTVVTVTGAKVEVKMPKASPGHWDMLTIADKKTTA